MMKAAIEVERWQLTLLINSLKLNPAVRTARTREFLEGLEKSRRALIVTSGGYADDQRITLLAKENPKRGASRERFALYRDGMSVAAARAAGILPGDRGGTTRTASLILREAPQ